MRYLKTANDLFDSKPSPRAESLVAAAVHGLARHYFRYSGLFHKSEYNLIATTTKTPGPEEDDRVQHCKRRTHHLLFV